jgi:hypothetical protein
MKDLFLISETVAFKEMKADPKGFMRRETFNRLSRRPEYSDLLPTSNPNFKEDEVLLPIPMTASSKINSVPAKKEVITE